MSDPMTHTEEFGMFVDAKERSRGRERLTLTWADRPGFMGWLTTVDHKRIGRRYIATAMVFFALAGLLALVMRLQLMFPNGRVLGPDRYNQFFSMHGSAMMFLFYFALGAWAVTLSTYLMSAPVKGGLNFTTGAHTDYHRPTDTADKIDYEDLDRVVDFAGAIVRQLMDLDAPPQFTRVDQSSQTPSRTGLRISTGTVPDYTTEVKGLLLGGVVAGGPAENAGLQKGDIIVEIAGQSITNIYDYTYALELLKVDQPVKVVYTRAGKRLETTLTPAVRR
jgi:membrane-associated protease RseP (regulator of RpoE activity)